MSYIVAGKLENKNTTKERAMWYKIIWYQILKLHLANSMRSTLGLHQYQHEGWGEWYWY